MTMLAVRQLSEKGREKTSQDREGVSQGLIVASAVDIAVDGLMLGIGFAAGAKQGLLLILALTFEMITLGLAIALELQQGRKSRGSILRNVIALAAVLVISAGLGWLGLSFLSGGLLVGVIAFGAAALLFLVTEELLTEAHEVTEGPWLTAAFFVGFLIILMLELLG